LLLLQPGWSASATLEEEIAATSIVLFDDLCIKHAFDETYFYANMGKQADKKLGRDDYEQFFSPVQVNGDFYRVPILEGKANIIVGRVDNGRVASGKRARNCIVILQVSKKIAWGLLVESLEGKLP